MMRDWTTTLVATISFIILKLLVVSIIPVVIVCFSNILSGNLFCFPFLNSSVLTLEIIVKRLQILLILF